MDIQPDVMQDLADNGKEGEQSVEADQGNNAGPGTTEEVGEGSMDIKSDGSYAGEMNADPN